ncbi:MAG: hypothetical protein AB8C95_13925 [Phycisphaeraceae bacterium]
MAYRSSITACKVWLVLLSLTCLLGCESPAPLTDYPYAQAWQQVSDAKQTNAATQMVGFALGVEIPAEMFDNAEQQAQEASQDASTPLQALDEIVADVSAYLVTAMPEYANATGTEWRLTLAVGTLIDGTEDKKLGSAMDRIARKLIVNDKFRKHFKVLSSTETEASAVIKQLSGTHPDDIYLPDDDTAEGVAKVHPDDLYVLTGRTDVFSSNRNRVLKTVTIIDVQHPQSRQIVLSKEFARTYYFHPGDMDYISETENQRRAERLAAQEALKK